MQFLRSCHIFLIAAAMAFLCSSVFFLPRNDSAIRYAWVADFFLPRNEYEILSFV